MASALPKTATVAIDKQMHERRRTVSLRLEPGMGNDSGLMSIGRLVRIVLKQSLYVRVLWPCENAN